MNPPEQRRRKRSKKTGEGSEKLTIAVAPSLKKDIQENAEKLGMSASEFVRFKVFDWVQTGFEQHASTGQGVTDSSPRLPTEWEDLNRLTTARLLEKSAQMGKEISDLQDRHASKMAALVKQKDPDKRTIIVYLYQFQDELKALNEAHLRIFRQLAQTAHEQASRVNESQRAEKLRKQGLTENQISKALGYTILGEE